MIQQFVKLKKKLTDHNHDKYITTPEFNRFTKELFAARLAQTRLVTKTNFDTKLKSFNQKLTQTKQSIYLTIYKRLIQFILEVKVILKKMRLKII